MESLKMLQQFNECYAKIQAIAQSQEWLELSNRNDVDPEMKTHSFLNSKCKIQNSK
ncbi:hypothetical protein [Nostoc sp. FACHB-190]|uniref:hypothetical protein n=1 Tax=Nostoc sp. FACHB-190 TaxID=2692838 RepID=UPI0016824B8D|nr:hypothetical protein [Nostoc sp. FACHB-190]MBD2302876.1 hypothetical protein [Nostoc sp. FACHB-190]